MAELVLAIPNSQATRVIDALCVAGGYDGSPQDKAAQHEFARGVVRTYVQQTVLQVEQRQAAAQAMASVVVEPVAID